MEIEKLTIKNKLIEIVNDVVRRTMKDEELDQPFDQLGIDSLDITAIIMEVEDAFDCDLSEELGINSTVRSFMGLIEAVYNNKLETVHE